MLLVIAGGYVWAAGGFCLAMCPHTTRLLYYHTIKMCPHTTRQLYMYPHTTTLLVLLLIAGAYVGGAGSLCVTFAWKMKSEREAGRRERERER